MGIEFELFPGKDLSGLFKDIYHNQQSKKQHISRLIVDIRKIVKTTNEYAILGPILKDLIDSSIKNDDSLVKLAVIAQRIMAAATGGGEGEGGVITEAEKKQLLEEIDSVVIHQAEVSDTKVNELATEIAELKEKSDK